MSSTLVTYSPASRKQAFGFLGLGFVSKAGQIVPESQGCALEISEGVP